MSRRSFALLLETRPYMRKYSSLKYLIYSSRAWDFAFRKLEFDKICYVYSNKSPFKYYISILEGVGAMLILIFKTVK